MKYSYTSCLRLFSLCLALGGVLVASVGCATGAKEERPSLHTDSPAPSERPAFSAVTFAGDSGPAGDALRLFGEQAGGGFVLMSGLEERAVPPMEFRQEPYESAIAAFAASIHSTYTHTPYYYLILPPEYGLLENVAVAAQLDVSYRAVSASAVFGAKTSLYVVFSALGKSLGLTIVADNFIAEERCGELNLPEAPLGVILEAILQSARIAPDSFVVESTPEYIFLRAARNETPVSVQLSAGEPTPDQQALLDSRVSLVLPPRAKDEQEYVFDVEPMALRDALLPLTEQLGIDVVAQRRLADIPINPCVINNARLSTAMDLLIRQWPLPEFGWELQPGRILIRER